MGDRDDLDARDCLLKPALVPTGDIHDSLSQGGERRLARVCRVVRSKD
jgi:hypothetical protein